MSKEQWTKDDIRELKRITLKLQWNKLELQRNTSQLKELHNYWDVNMYNTAKLSLKDL